MPGVGCEVLHVRCVSDVRCQVPDVKMAGVRCHMCYGPCYAGLPGGKFVHKQLLKLLPDGKGSVAPADLHRKIIDLKATSVMKYASRGAQGRAEALLEQVSAIKMGIPVSTVGMDTSEFFKEVFRLMKKVSTCRLSAVPGFRFMSGVRFDVACVRCYVLDVRCQVLNVMLCVMC